MELSNRSRGVNRKFFEASLCRVHGCLRGRHQAPHDGATQHEPSMWTTHSARRRCNSINGMARLTSRQGRFKRSVIERYRMLCRHACSRIEELPGFQHGVHDDSQLSRDSHGSSFEANSLAQLKPPCSQRTLFGTAREND